MKITKHVHSCLILEDQGKTVIIDPGKYGYDEYPLELHNSDVIDFVLITHEHGDHLYLPFIKKILSRYPKASIICSERVTDILKSENILSLNEGNSFIHLSFKQHERSIDPEVVPNTVFTVFNNFIHSGDNIEFSESGDIIALPIDCGLWGKVASAAERLVTLKPKFIVPIHDYRLKDEIKTDVFRRLGVYFKEHNIEFLPMKPYDTISIL